MKINVGEEEAQLGIEICDYYRARTRLGVTEEQISEQIDLYHELATQRDREARERLGWREYLANWERTDWSTFGEPKMLDVLEHRWEVDGGLARLLRAWLETTTEWREAMDGLADVTRQFSNDGRTLLVAGRQTWLPDVGRGVADGPLRSVFTLDPSSSSLVDYTITFLDQKMPSGRIYPVGDQDIRPPAREEDWLYVFKMGESAHTPHQETPGKEGRAGTAHTSCEDVT